MSEHKWPTREELAKRVRSVYLGEETPYHFYAPYKHLVTDEMVAASDAELQALSQALGPHVRGYRAEEAQAGAGPGWFQTSAQQFSDQPPPSCAGATPRACDISRVSREEIRRDKRQSHSPRRSRRARPSNSKRDVSVTASSPRDESSGDA
jgi:hypothetical protein